MIIKRITVRNFGKLQDRTMEFSDGINVLYGDNESGKTTTHTFVRSMLYGIQRQRGRAARKDAYNLYLPWKNSADYGGTLWFENGGKNFRLTRNFYKENPTTEFLCEDDGEILDVAQGDLAAATGVTRQTIGMIEAGDYNPSLKLCLAICRALGKTLDELFWEE